MEKIRTIRVTGKGKIKSCLEWLLFNQLLDESHAWENMSSAALEKAKEFVTVE